MQDRSARHDIEEEQKLERNFKKNVFAGKTTFVGIVMSDPGGVPTISEGQVTQNNFKAVKVLIEGIDDSFIDPQELINSTSDASKRGQIFNNVIGGLLTAYPDSELRNADPNPAFQMGCRVELKFYDQGPQSDHHGKMRGLRYVKVLNSSDSRYSSLAGEFGSLGGSAFSTGEAPSLNSSFGSFASLEQALDFNTPKTPTKGPGAVSVTQIANYITNPTEPVVGSGVPSAGTNALAEITRWAGRKENDLGVKPFLDQYWDNVIESGDTWFKNTWTPTGTAWSAAFISYVLRGTSFKGAGSHLRYFKKNGNTRSWNLFTLLKPATIKAQLGDVLGYDGHSDIVYKIEGNKAHLAGGNMSDTAKEVKVLNLSGGNYIIGQTKGYELLLKKT